MTTYDATPARAGVVSGIDAQGRLLVSFRDWSGPPQAISLPPAPGGGPLPLPAGTGDTVLVHYGVSGYPLAVVPLTRAPGNPGPGAWPGLAVHKTAAYTLTASDPPIITDISGLTLTLPPAANATKALVVKANAGVTGTVIAARAGQTIDGAATQTLTAALATATLVSDGGSAWFIV